MKATTIAHKDLVKILAEKTMHISDSSKLAGSIAAYLNMEHKTQSLSSLVRDIMQYRLEHGLVEAVAISAHELPPLVINDIKSLLKDRFPHAKSFSVDCRIDPSVIGGIRIDLPKETLDISVKSKLNLFKRLVAEDN
jgi:F0F1-type ATP synthase delta subunit